MAESSLCKLFMFAAVVLTWPYSPAVAPCRAQEGWSLELSIGPAYNMPSPLWIRQVGQRRMRLIARFSTRPFSVPLYYGVRLDRRCGPAEWALEFIHHKIYLDNRSYPVQWLSATHGFNIVVLERGVFRGPLVYRMGGGLVLSHPESTIGGRVFDEKGGILGRGYYLSGPVVLGAVTAYLPRAGGAAISVELKGTLAYVWMPVSGGSAVILVGSIHALLGVRFPLHLP